MGFKHVDYRVESPKTLSASIHLSPSDTVLSFPINLFRWAQSFRALKNHLSLCVLNFNTSSSGHDHPPPLSPCSYAMTLNWEPLTIFCPEHKSLRFFLLLCSKAVSERLPWSLLSAQINMLHQLTGKPVPIFSTLWNHTLQQTAHHTHGSTKTLKKGSQYWFRARAEPGYFNNCPNNDDY